MNKATLYIALLAWCSVICRSDPFFPIVPDDIQVTLFAKEPLVRNPCAITFDAKGRLCVGMGPQYRNPQPQTPGDSIFILLDSDGDGEADGRKEFAKGFNSIQGLAWKGKELWVANAPDLTIVRDLDGDDEADEYVRLFTDLGNLEHALHGLNWGPDGKLYMSKGNSKGLTQPPHRIAPRAFRELWGVYVPGLPDFPEPAAFKKGSYQKNYHDPQDDWGREGGILRCHANGENLEIVSRGFRNPWDITFDDEFTWLGTDNDQVQGDKIFSPFYGAHFGWGHSWSFDWDGQNHLPTVPASGPLFEGSGAGIIFCGLERYPERYRNIFLINDWLRREVYIYRPTWSGAHLVSADAKFDRLASAGGGRSMERSQGKKFDPVDIEIGPDEAIYISSWGREYGANYQGKDLANEGRIYRLWPKAASPVNWQTEQPDQPIEQWTVAELLNSLRSHLPVWRANAQEELIRRGTREELKAVLEGDNVGKSLQTWTAWTLGQIDKGDTDLDLVFANYADSEKHPLNLGIQSLRILAYRKRLPALLGPLLDHNEARIRLETVLAIRQAGDRSWAEKVIERARKENDRIVFFAIWGALKSILPEAELEKLLTDKNASVRRAAVLALLEGDRLNESQLQSLANDSDTETAALARRRLAGKSETIIRGRPLQSPQAFGSQERPASIQEILSQLPSADPVRGRSLFLDERGAGCIACHRLEGAGNTFAPDLSEIGSRADAEFIIRSIIEPSAAITEGFVAHSITTITDETFTGIVLQESGTGIRLALGTGEPVTIPSNLIRKRSASSQSAMPANYATLLNAQQIADLTAFLSTQKAGSTTRAHNQSGKFKVRREHGHMDFFLGTNRVATYIFDHPELTRPAFVNVRTISGIPVTREFPAPADADHRWMHPGIGMSFGWLDGNDYWRMKAKVKAAEFTYDPGTNSDVVRWATENHYLEENSTNIVCVEEARYQISATPDGLLLEIDSQFHNHDRSFAFGDQEESGLCIRMATQLCVKGGSGSILNNRGEVNESGTWGREFDWIDYSGTSENKRLGLLIVPHPQNPRKSWSHSRDYGVLVANPFPRQPKEQREPIVKTIVSKGDRYRLRYSVLIYEKAL